MNITVKHITRNIKVEVSTPNITVKRPISNIKVTQVGRRGPQGAMGPPGVDGQDGRNIMLRNNGDWVQWKYEDEAEWTNLIELADLKGEPGKDGEDGLPGADGREVELQATSTHIQWRYEGGEWVDLIALDDLKGADGAPGPQGEKGEKGDAGPGVAAGGTTGQVLAKASNDDYDTEWVDPPSSGVPDIEWQEIHDFPVIDIFAGAQPINMGTDGMTYMRWYRNGRHIIGKIWMIFTPDSSGYGNPGESVFLIPSPFLPALPKPPPLATAVPSEFGYLSLMSDFDNELVGSISLAGPAIVDVGLTNDPAQVAMAFVSPPKETPFGYEGLLGNGHPVELNGRMLAYQGAFNYEAAYPEEE